MLGFGKDNQKEQENELIGEDFNINFSPLWEDEPASTILPYVFSIIQIILLIWVLIKIKWFTFY